MYVPIYFVVEEMPKKGYKTITVKAEVYDYFFNEWLKVKEEYAIKKGIQSFSAFITYRLAQLMAEDKTDENKNKSLKAGR
jgi:hypothetical protein